MKGIYNILHHIYGNILIFSSSEYAVKMGVLSAFYINDFMRMKKKNFIFESRYKMIGLLNVKNGQIREKLIIEEIGQVF